MKRQAGPRKHVVLSPLFRHSPLRPNWDEAIDLICPEIISELEPFGCVCGALTPELAHSRGTRARWLHSEISEPGERVGESKCESSHA